MTCHRPPAGQRPELGCWPGRAEMSVSSSRCRAAPRCPAGRGCRGARSPLRQSPQSGASERPSDWKKTMLKNAKFSLNDFFCVTWLLKAFLPFLTLKKCIYAFETGPIPPLSQNRGTWVAVFLTTLSSSPRPAIS